MLQGHLQHYGSSLSTLFSSFLYYKFFMEKKLSFISLFCLNFL